MATKQSTMAYLNIAPQTFKALTIHAKKQIPEPGD